MIRNGLFFLLASLTVFSHGQEYCSHSVRSAFVNSSVSPGYNELQNCYDVRFYDLELEVSDTSTFLRAATGITFEALSEIDTLVFELTQSMIIDSIFLDGQKVPEFNHNDGLAMVFPRQPLSSGSLHQLKIWYQGGQSDGGFFSGLTNRTDITYKKPVTYTLSEPFQASSWFPVKQNLEDKADSVRIRITTPEGLLAGSNGLLTATETLPDGRSQFTWESRYPIAFYLISIAVSDYLDYSFYVHFEEDNDSLLVQNYIYDHPDIFTNEKGRIDKTADMILFFSSLYGKYPFYEEKYGHAMAPMGGGMEHQTMTTLQNFNFDLVAHELAHQWFGNNVTCGTWQDIWINEGFASYSEYLAREALIGLPEAVAWMENAHSYAIREPDGSIYLTEAEARNTFRIFSFSLSYKKGASILHMLRNEIYDDELFFRIFREFQLRFKDSVATAEDFLLVVNELSGVDFAWFFDQWYYGRGFPVLQATWKQRADSLYIETFQGSSSDDPDFFRMHIDFLLTFSDGKDSLLRVHIDKPEKKFNIYTGKKLINIEIDPYSKNLMNASLYEFIPQGQEVEIIPNPFTDTLYLNFRERSSEKSIVITNLQGKVVYQEMIGNKDSAELNLSGLAGGVYLIVIENGVESKAARIIKL